MRFYIPDFDESRPQLEGEAHTHAAYSLRIHPGDFLTVFDGSGVEYACSVVEVKKDRTALNIIERKENVGETKLFVTLYMSVIKQDRFEFAVQKATELGVDRIVPVYSTYSQRSVNLNLERMRKIAISSCEQCGRSKVPTIEEAIDFSELTERAASTYLIFPWERELHGTLKSAIDTSKQDISVFIGPEGGITTSEKEALERAGAKAVTLGTRILRAETAAIAALSVIYYEMGEWIL